MTDTAHPRSADARITDQLYWPGASSRWKLLARLGDRVQLAGAVSRSVKTSRAVKVAFTARGNPQ